MGLTDIKKELRKLEKDKLIDLIADLYKKNKSVKDFFDYYINPDDKELFNKYKAKVFESFYPKRGLSFDLKSGKQAISDFKKLETSSDLLVDLMLTYVETGVDFTIDFGDINESFYSSLANMYVQALTLMRKENLLDKFAIRAKKVMDKSDNIGWGFGDYVSDAYSDFYQSEYDNEDEND